MKNQALFSSKDKTKKLKCRLLQFCRKINPSDCVDMHCDAQKKALIRDTDGTFLRMGVPATVVPDSAYEYNGDPALGLGDFRIPKPMLTTLEGDRIQYEDARDYPGINFAFCIFSIMRRGVPCQNNLKNLDLSYKTDLEFWDCFGSESSISVLQIRKGNWNNLGMSSHISA